MSFRLARDNERKAASVPAGLATNCPGAPVRKRRHKSARLSARRAAIAPCFAMHSAAFIVPHRQSAVGLREKTFQRVNVRLQDEVIRARVPSGPSKMCPTGEGDD